MRKLNMYSFHNRLRHCLASMAHGNSIKLKSGHTLVIPEDHDEPGLLFTSYKSGKPDQETVFQIGSDTAWMMLVQHAREMTKDEMTTMILGYTNIKIPRRY